MSLTPYLMTVALHAVVLSAASVILVAVVRNPRAKAAVALGCLMATAVLSWLTPLRPAERPALTIPILPARLPEIEPAAPPPPLERANLPVVERESLSPALRSRNLQPTLLLPVLWAAGALVGLLGITGALWRGGRWQRSLEIADDHDWAILHDALPLELDRDAIRISTETISPCVTGFLMPRIVIPRSLLDESKPRELAWAIRHELTHLDGHDSRWAFAIRMARSLFWWNPLVHGLASTWSEARERTCDQAAAMTGAERADYGDFLVTMATALSPRPARGPSMAKHGAAKRLKGRIASLLAAAPGLPPKVSRPQAATCGLVFAAALGGTSLLALDKEDSASAAGSSNLTLEKILNPPPQLDVSMALLKTSQPFCTQGQIFSPAELDLKLRAASNGRGIQLLPLPRRIEEIGAASWAHLTSSTNKEPSNPEGADLLEVLLDHPHSSAPDTTMPPWNGKTTTTPFLGWVVGWSARKNEENLHFSMRAAYSFAPGYHLAPGFGMKGENRQVDFEATAEIPSGKAVGFTFGEVEPGVHVSVVFGLVTAKPWELPALWEPGAFPSISPKAPSAGGQPVKMTEFKTDDPDYLQAQKLSIAAHKAWLDAMDNLPENAELIRQRDFFIQQLKEKPERAKELTWKIHRLGEAIFANAQNDIGVRFLKQVSEKHSRSSFSIMSRISVKSAEERNRRELDRQRWEMHQFERQRHRW